MGALIGIGVMVCGILSFSAFDRWKSIKEQWKTLFTPSHQENPVLLRRISKQWKVKEIIVSK